MAANPVTPRERKRMRTMADIQRVALRLFAEQGFDATTVEQIAVAADISPATFFRYFRSKSDLMETDEFDPLLARTFVARPAGEDVFTAIRETLRELLPLIEQRDREVLLERTRLMSGSSGLQAQLWQGQRANIDSFAAAIGVRTGADPGSLEVRAQAAAVVAVLLEAIQLWAAGDGRDDPLALMERGLGQLSAPPGP
jgi:AcrR family transcriptional regulator